MTRPRREYRYNAQEAVRMIMEMEDSSDVEDVEGSESEDDGEIDHLETDVEDSTSEIDNSLATANNLQETSSSDNDENENVRFNEPQDGTSIGENIYTAKSGKRWSPQPPPNSRTRGANIFSKKPGPKVAVQSEVEAFDLFFSEDMYATIVKYTNKHGREQHSDENSKWRDIDEEELRAFVGLLILMGVSKGNHESVRDLWSSGSLGRPIFKAVMPVNRFEQILRHLRFDNLDTRHERRTTDKFAPYRDLWNTFIENCKRNYVPSALLCIDEQLIPYRGRCPFCQYLPAKPDKYGMKVFLLADCESGYIFNGIPYTGKTDSTSGPTVGLAKKMVIDLSKDLWNAGRNITADNYFTDFQLAEELLNNRTTYVGTVGKNRRDIPNEFTTKKRVAGSSIFGFNQYTTLVSYAPKKNKSVILLSTMHHDSEVDKDTGKPDIIMFYNSTKGAVRMIMEMEDSSDVEDVEGSESEDDGEIDHLETDVEDSTSEIDNSLATANNLQETSSSDNDENENVRFNEPQDGTSIGENIYTAKSGKRWSPQPPPNSRTRGANIFSKKPGPKVAVQSEVEAFDLFFSEDMYATIVKYTNKHGREQHSDENSKWRDIDEEELRAFVGLLILMGVSKGNHESVRDLWSSGSLGRPIFKAVMPVNRFEQILRHLRFDNLDTRHERRTTDKFAPYRDLWNTFIENCKRNYVPSALLCIDEQLIPYRGRCPFCQYLPAKPDKYGMKVFLLADCESGYIFNGIPYTGKTDSTSGPTVGLAKKMVIDLSKDLWNAGRNITADNYFTDFQLAEELLNNRTTYVGTVGKNRRDIPNEFTTKKRVAGSSIFGFNQYTTLVSYAPKKNKSVILLSTMHHDSEVDKDTGKPDIIMFYNSTKGAVDTVDQLCHSYSVQRKSKRWPLAYFMNNINLAGINAFICFLNSFPGWNKGKLNKRRLYLCQLGEKLVQPVIHKRSQNLVGIGKSIQEAMTACNIPPVNRAGPSIATPPSKSKRKRCYRCRFEHKDRKTVRVCIKCQHPVCAEHSKKDEVFKCHGPECNN